MSEDLVGTVTHYFATPSVAVVRVTDSIRTGDVVQFRGHTTDFEQQIRSMEVEHARLEAAEAGTEVAIQVVERVRKHDNVYRVTP